MQFKEIIGQESTKERLRQSVSTQRISHAQLFLGKPGSNTLPLALAYAQYINCESRSPLDSCGVCPSCIKFNRLIHPDLHFIFPVATTSTVKSKPRSRDFITSWREINNQTHSLFTLNDWYQQIGIDNKQGIINAEDCNDIIHTLSYKSYESEYKIMVIWMVEKLFHAAAPKLLKILEEPPEKTLFILIAEDQEHILKTIRSRTQLIKIPQNRPEDIETALFDYPQLTSANKSHLINMADGDLIRLNTLINESAEHQEYFVLYRQWMRSCYGMKMLDLISFSEEVTKLGRERQKSLLRYGLEVVRSCMLNQYGLASKIRMDGEELDFIRKFSPFINAYNMIDIANILSKGIYHTERNAQASMLFMDMSINISRLMHKKSA